jgi:cytochrome c oxidase assembly protein subunit 15
VAQAVLGGFTVKGALDYGWVMGHFGLSMLILLAAVLLVWRASHEPAPQDAADAAARTPVDRTLVLWARALADSIGGVRALGRPPSEAVCPGSVASL